MINFKSMRKIERYSNSNKSVTKTSLKRNVASAGNLSSSSSTLKLVGGEFEKMRTEFAKSVLEKLTLSETNIRREIIGNQRSINYNEELVKGLQVSLHQNQFKLKALENMKDLIQLQSKSGESTGATIEQWLQLEMCSAFMETIIGKPNSPSDSSRTPTEEER